MAKPEVHEIVWHGVERRDLDAMVLADLSAGVDCDPEDLIFHHVWLGDDPDGRTVFVWGEENDDRWHAEYHETIEWGPLHG